VFHRRIDQFLRQALTAAAARNEETDDGPDIPGVVFRAAERPECRARRDRAPGDRLIVFIGKKADRRAFANAARHRRFAAGIVRPRALGGGLPPQSAPAVFRRAGALEQPLEVGPVFAIDRPEGETTRAPVRHPSR
jgi:hypothetical protein